MTTNPRILVAVGGLLLAACAGGPATDHDTCDPGPADATTFDADAPLLPSDAPSRDVLPDVDATSDIVVDPLPEPAGDLYGDPSADLMADHAGADPSPLDSHVADAPSDDATPLPDDLADDAPTDAVPDLPPDAPCVPVDPPDEVCNGLDDDCDGTTDEGTCADEWNCTTDVCDPRDGSCHHLLLGECAWACAMHGGVWACPPPGDCCQYAAACDTSRIPDGECVYETLSCNSGNPCQVGHCDPDGCACVFELIDCDDDNPCTIDTCSPVSGCVHAPVPQPCP